MAPTAAPIIATTPVLVPESGLSGSRFERAWQVAMLSLMLAVTFAWWVALGYGVAALIRLVI